MSTELFILTGASRGMGQAMALQLLQSGPTLVCMSRQTSPALSEKASRQGGALEQWQVDLADSQAAAARLTGWLNVQPQEAFGSATLINNAGVIPRIAPLAASDPRELAWALQVGLEAPLVLSAAFLAATEHWQVPRKVLNISSGLGRRAMASSAAYCAAKAGMDHFTRSMAMEEALKPHGARVCSLAPGVIDTDMQVQLRGTPAADFPEQANFARLHDNGQLSSPQQAAQRVLAWLTRADFGSQPVADVRDAA